MTKVIALLVCWDVETKFSRVGLPHSATLLTCSPAWEKEKAWQKKRDCCLCCSSWLIRLLLLLLTRKLRTLPYIDGVLGRNQVNTIHTQRHTHTLAAATEYLQFFLLPIILLVFVFSLAPWRLLSSLAPSHTQTNTHTLCNTRWHDSLILVWFCLSVLFSFSLHSMRIWYSMIVVIIIMISKWRHIPKRLKIQPAALYIELLMDVAADRYPFFLFVWACWWYTYWIYAAYYIIISWPTQRRERIDLNHIHRDFDGEKIPSGSIDST